MSIHICICMSIQVSFVMHSSLRVSMAREPTQKPTAAPTSAPSYAPTECTPVTNVTLPRAPRARACAGIRVRR